MTDLHLTIRSNDPDLHQTVWWFQDNHVQSIPDRALDALEEALYVLWELIPASPMWQEELSQVGVTSFQYAEEEAYIVRWVGDLTYEVTF